MGAQCGRVGGDGGDAGDINGGRVSPRIRPTLGSLGTAGDGGIADPIFLSFLLGGSKGTDGRPGSLN